jgi:hypothetical protein
MTSQEAQKIIENPDLLKALAEGELEEKFSCTSFDSCYLPFSGEFDFLRKCYRRKPDSERRVFAEVKADKTLIDITNCEQKLYFERCKIFDAVERL